MIQIVVEFTGLAKAIAGKQEITLSIPEGTTYREVVRRLGEMYPGLIGILIAEDGETFLSSNMFVIDGDLANPVMIMDQKPKNGEHIHLMSVITGG
ncbi:MAG: MoaD/ThiS family protein [Anaerolineaceae bacterium]|jgi:molybdopterin converting factor small subunit|nr:MoaD/ThiS family protein [Anaerolineaceae bacterium]